MIKTFIIFWSVLFYCVLVFAPTFYLIDKWINYAMGRLKDFIGIAVMLFIFFGIGGTLGIFWYYVFYWIVE